LGVLDLDSPDPGRFDSEDAEGLGTLVRLLLEGSDFRRLVDTGHLGDRRPG
jgi:putative methionine-R-sulfoxide reductase with GAF domain